MAASHRFGLALAALVGVAALAPTAEAQARGMPVFTNPNYATGVRVHADVGVPVEGGRLGDTTFAKEKRVVQAGVTFALGPLGLGANVGARWQDLEERGVGDKSTRWMVSGLAQLRLAGGRPAGFALSAFGGASFVTTREEVAQGAGLDDINEFWFPVGGSLGYRIPLGALGGLTIWGAPRAQIRYRVCEGCWINPQTHQFEDNQSETRFRWAAGADLSILRALSVRAAYDSGKIGEGIFERNVAWFGLGASLGIGGMR